MERWDRTVGNLAVAVVGCSGRSMAAAAAVDVVAGHTEAVVEDMGRTHVDPAVVPEIHCCDR